MSTKWLLVAMGVLTAIHFVVLAYTLTHPRPSRAKRAETGDCSDRVVCPTCGESNEPSYRFCRQCVSELPAGGSVLREHPDTWRRRTL